MSKDLLYDRLRSILLWYGPQRISKIYERLPDVPRKQIARVLEENHYTFDFKMDNFNKVWFVNE